VNKPGESTFSMLEEDQLLEIASSSGCKSMSETTSNLFILDKVKAEYSEIATKALKSLLHFQHLVFVKQVFCGDSNQKKITG